MTEATIVQRLIKDLKKLLPAAVIFKHNDLSTAGIPDLSINHHQCTLWVEVKYCRRGESHSKFLKHFDKLQLASNVILYRQVPVWYLIAYDDRLMGFDGLGGLLFNPRYLKDFLALPQVSIRSLGGYYMYRGTFMSTVDFLADMVRR